MLPEAGWDTYEKALRAIGENRTEGKQAHVVFLRVLGMVAADGRLSALGECYFQAAFINRDERLAKEVLAESVLGYPPASAVAQLLAGVAEADRDTAETVLRSQGFGEGLTDRKLGSLLALMHKAGVIKYSKGNGVVEVLVAPASGPRLPRSIFFSGQTPYGNKAWLRRLLRECESYVWWLDKHFQHPAFDELWEALDGNRIAEVRVLSLRLEDHKSRKVKQAYTDLRAELDHRGVDFTWRVMDSSWVRQTHDRWIISANGAWNVPNVNAIYSGQHSEVSLSEAGNSLRELFKGYWDSAVPVYE